MSQFDVVIVGAGIAGASLAATLAPFKKILLIEAEDQPGYHATGRSAAFWAESYGGPDVQPLTTASGQFLRNPPADFSKIGFLSERGALHIGTMNDRLAAESISNEFRNSGVRLDVLNSDTISKQIPMLRDQWSIGLWEPDCSDIDVAALHQAYLKFARVNGAEIMCRHALRDGKWSGGRWQIDIGGEILECHTLVNAAGAWADDVAVKCGVKPLSIRPFRRTIIQIEMIDPVSASMPLIIAIDGSFYFKPATGGRSIWLSPHDETPSDACDARPEEIDIAQAIDRFVQVTQARFGKIEAKWAGLRSFSADRLPVIGPATDNPAFFWFAGQGGFGIQTAPAAACGAASFLCDLVQRPSNVELSRYLPSRFA
jgi:D-arginine dehydrogenase